MDTPLTDAALRKAVKDWGRGDYADAHVIEDLTDFCRRLEASHAALEAARYATQMLLNHVESWVVDKGSMHMDSYYEQLRQEQEAALAKAKEIGT